MSAFTRFFAPVRRAFARTRTALFVDWKVFGSTIHGRSRTRDISRGGAFVRTFLPEPVGTPLVLVLDTILGRREVHARVTRACADGMAVRFTRPL